MNPTTSQPQPHGHAPSHFALMATRDLESHGFYLTPLLQPDFDVLDAGCGPATITTGIAQSVFPGHVTALDASPAHLEFGRRLCEGREIVNIDFVAGSAENLPFDSASFDVVFANDLLEQMSDPRRAFEEFHRVTRPGGFIALCGADWDHAEMTLHSKHLGRAITAYRALQETSGGNTRTGENLCEWMAAAGFMPLSHDEWVEEFDDTKLFAEHLASALDTDGQFHHATVLRNWAANPEAKFRLTWKFATGVRADAHRRPRMVE